MSSQLKGSDTPPMLDDGERPVPPPLLTEKQIRPGVGISVFVVLFGLLSFGGIVWFVSDQGSLIGGAEEIPLVRAEKSAVRVRPENPGGLKVPYKDKLILKNLTTSAASTSGETEILLARPEQPLQLPYKKTEEKKGKDVEKTDNKNISVLDNGQNSSPVEAKSKSQEKKKQKTGSAALLTSKKTLVIPGNNASEKVSNNVKVLAHSQAKMGTHRIQIASVKNKAGAARFWKSVKRKHRSLLNNLKSRIQRVEIKAKGTFYRVQSSVVSRSRANEICSILRKEKQACIIVAK